MNAIKRHPYFTAWIACCVVLVASGVWWLQHLRHSSRLELASLAQKAWQKEQLLLSQALVSAPEQEEPAADQGSVVVVSSADEEIPRKPLEAFIEIARTKEELRRLAASHEVALLPEESFGFAAYANEGPPESQLRAVHQQLGMIRLVLEKLFPARPDKLIAIQREQPRSAGRDGLREAAADYFTADTRLDPRLTGLVEGRALRLEFTGQTSVLQDFLHALAITPEPLLVHSVGVEPLPNSSKFSVVVEWAELVAAGGNGGVVPGRPATTLALWPKSSAPTSGFDQGYELFAPPVDSRSVPPAAVKNGVTDGFELLTVKREPYRLQLVGYYGVPGDYTAAFVRPGSPGTLLAREGHRFESLGLVLRNIAVKKLGTVSNAGQPGYVMTSWAELWDERKLESVTLVGHERLLTEIPQAVLRLGPPPTPPREFRTGDLFQDGTVTYCIEHIQLEPAEMVLLRHAPGQAEPERRVLHPPARPMAPPRTDLAAADRSH